jgi:hypothetical protein
LPGEQRQAQSWATAYVRRKGILGKLVGVALSGDISGPSDLVGEPATAAVITASIPVLIQLARRALTSRPVRSPSPERGVARGRTFYSLESETSRICRPPIALFSIAASTESDY